MGSAGRTVLRCVLAKLLSAIRKRRHCASRCNIYFFWAGCQVGNLMNHLKLRYVSHWNHCINMAWKRNIFESLDRKHWGFCVKLLQVIDIAMKFTRCPQAYSWAVRNTPKPTPIELFSYLQVRFCLFIIGLQAFLKVQHEVGGYSTT